MKYLLSSLPLFIVLFLLGGCEKASDEKLVSPVQEHLPLQESAVVDFIDHAALDLEEQSISYLALGDSYTIGESVDPAQRWPVQLAEQLSIHPNLDVPAPTIIAQTGWTTSNLNNAMNAANIDEENFDLVSLLIGVNNQYQGLSLDDYAVEFSALLERAIDLANGDSSRVFVVSIPDYGYTPFGSSNQDAISDDLQSFNQTCFNITMERGVNHYNITPISQQWPEVENLVASDGLHPSGYQYSLWVDAIQEGVVQQLLP